MKRQRLLAISRPRFWIYVLGPFLLGTIAAGDPRLWTTEVFSLVIGWLLFFTFPANLLIYGVNDMYDYETDRLNPKKQAYEELMHPRDQQKLWNNIYLICLPFLLLLFVASSYVWMALLLFVFVSLQYSATPVRAKAHPPLDIVFSSLIYITPSVIGFYVAGGSHISWVAVVAGLLWAQAMQTYSAVPDIQADTEARVSTLATVLGKNYSLLFCLCAYLGAALLAVPYLGILAYVLGAIYVIMVAISYYAKEVFFWYTKFPLINTIAGMSIFFYLALSLM